MGQEISAAARGGSLRGGNQSFHQIADINGAEPALASPDSDRPAPADRLQDLEHVRVARAIDDRPSAFRYPRGEGVGVPLPKEGQVLPIGKGRIMREGSSVAILNFGARLPECLKAAEKLSAYGLSATVADARFAKPLDADLVRRLARNHEVMLTIEEGAVGGFGAHVLHFLSWDGLLDRGLKIRTMALPDRFLDQDSPERMYETALLDAKSIVATALLALGRERDAAVVA